MANVTDICNKALAKIGDEITITTLEEDSKAARYCKLLYEPTKNFLLRQYAWRFALKRYSLAPTGEKPVFGYGYTFNIPKDCLRVVKTEDDMPFTVEGNHILYDSNVLNFIGITNISDANTFDACFIEALTTQLAIELCVPITGDLQAKQQLKQDLAEQIRIAKKCSAFEVYPITMQVSGALESRL